MSKQQPELTGARWLAIWARLSALALLPMLAGYAGDWHWLLDLCAHFRWQYALALALGMLPALLLGRRGLAAVLLAGSTLNSWSLANATGPAMEAGPTSPSAIASTWKLLVVNVHVGLTDARPLLDLIEQESPDVIGIIELSPDVAKALAGLDARYPTHRSQPRDDPFGIGLWTRRPGAVIEILSTPPLGFPSLVLRWAEPLPSSLWLVHPFPPISAEATLWRDQQLAHIAGRVGRDPQVLVAGDFNATPWSQAYRSFRRNTELQDSSAATLPWPTWFGGSAVASVLAVPIDHVLHGKGWRVVERRIGPDIGSDHRPLIVSFAARQ
ncbi:MAG TPA: endonuclease/exonuclease/phosphatase family protein [Xanthomonadales bacterium]|nr:endonuclease/exonuclease/phosphatase family protein [Xanthomonadales bacterium]